MAISEDMGDILFEHADAYLAAKLRESGLNDLTSGETAAMQAGINAGILLAFIYFDGMDQDSKETWERLKLAVPPERKKG